MAGWVAGRPAGRPGGRLAARAAEALSAPCAGVAQRAVRHEAHVDAERAKALVARPGLVDGAHPIALAMEREEGKGGGRLRQLPQGLRQHRAAQRQDAAQGEGRAQRRVDGEGHALGEAAEHQAAPVGPGQPLPLRLQQPEEAMALLGELPRLLVGGRELSSLRFGGAPLVLLSFKLGKLR